MFQVYVPNVHLFQAYVASVSFGCCTTRSRCCIYMQVFLYVCYKYFILMFAYVYNGYTRVFKFFLVSCKCFRRMLQVFQLFRMYVVSVSSGCCTCCNTREKRRGRWSHVGGRNAGSGGDVLVRARETDASTADKKIFGPKAHNVSFALGPAKEPARVHLPTNLRSSSMSTTGRLSSSHSF
jgi:hypothetical protein